MRRILLGLFFMFIVTCPSWAVSTPTEEDYRTLDETREKLVRMRREMDKFMKDLIGPYAEMDKSGGIFGQDVRVDVSQDENNVTVRADLPGMTKDRIDVTLEKNRLLRISGSRDVMTHQTAPGVVRQERMTGRFERSLELPAECESQGIKATYNEGVLEIVLPKKKGQKEEMIKVNVQ